MNGGKASTIEIAASRLIQLFNSLDPSPFPERDLDDEVEAYIVSWAKELSPSPRFRILIHLPGTEVIKAEQQGLRKAISNYFGYRSEMLQRSERECLRMGRRFLIVGIWSWRHAVCHAHSDQPDAFVPTRTASGRWACDFWLGRKLAARRKFSI